MVGLLCVFVSWSGCIAYGLRITRCHVTVPILGAIARAPIIGAMKKSTHSREYWMLRGALRDLRAAANLSQRDLAARLKVPHSWVAKVESGERRIDVVELYWFADACGAEPQAALSKLIEQFASKPGTRRPSGGRSK